MKIICPEKTYEQALIECGMETLENRREKMCIKLINDVKDLIHKLNEHRPMQKLYVFTKIFCIFLTLQTCFIS